MQLYNCSIANRYVSQLIYSIVCLFMKNMVETVISINYFMYKQKDFIAKCKHQETVFSLVVQLWPLREFCLRAIQLEPFQCVLKGHVEKAMAPHSSTLAWKIPWTEEPGRLQSMESLGVEHD